MPHGESPSSFMSNHEAKSYAYTHVRLVTPASVCDEAQEVWKPSNPVHQHSRPTLSSTSEDDGGAHRIFRRVLHAIQHTTKCLSLRRRKGYVAKPYNGRHCPLEASPPYQWLPLTLQASYLAIWGLISLSLGVVVLILTIYSVNNNGISDYHSSAAFLFAWRFLPTILAVVYSLAITTLRNDVRRTEAFARLSKPGGATAASTLFLSNGFWWQDLAEGWRKRSNGGGRSWSLLFVSLLNILAILAISPLSAGVFSLTDVPVVRDTAFRRLLVPESVGFNGTTNDETYYRTTSSIIQNLVTSAWLYDSYAILPVWPADLAAVPFGGVLTARTEGWQAQTSVYQTDMQCLPMNVSSNEPSVNDTYSKLHLSSEDGCSLNFFAKVITSSSTTLSDKAIGWWGGIASTFYPHPSNQTAACGNREILMLKRHLFATTTNDESIAQICTPVYYSADNVNVSVSNAGGLSMVKIDTQAFDTTKKKIDLSKMKFEELENLFTTDQRWSSHVMLPGAESPLSAGISGPFILLAAMYGDMKFDQDSFKALPEAKDLLGNARKIRQRFYGEALQAALVPTGTRNAQAIDGQVTAIENRLFAAYGTGIALGACLLCSSVLLLLLFFSSRSARRPLNLARDPASAASVLLMAQGEDVRRAFHGLDQTPETLMQVALRGSTFQIKDNLLYISAPPVRRSQAGE